MVVAALVAVPLAVAEEVSVEVPLAAARLAEEAPRHAGKIRHIDITTYRNHEITK